MADERNKRQRSTRPTVAGGVILLQHPDDTRGRAAYSSVQEALQAAVEAWSYEEWPSAARGTFVVRHRDSGHEIARLQLADPDIDLRTFHLEWAHASLDRTDMLIEDVGSRPAP